MIQLNDVANLKPHSELIANIQKENRHLREIQQENKELRAALEEHQTALEYIMSKYRTHASEQIYRSRINFVKFQNKRYNEIIRQQAEKINEMAAVMDQAALIDEQRANTDEEIMARLKVENKVSLSGNKCNFTQIDEHFLGPSRIATNIVQVWI